MPASCDVFLNTVAYRAGATCTLRHHRMHVSDRSQRFPIKLVAENSPRPIENGTVKGALLRNVLARTLNSPFRRCRHVFNLQVFSENSCLVLAGFRRNLFDEITTDIGDTVIKLCHRDFLFVPILPELLHSFETAPGSVEFLNAFLGAMHGSKNVASGCVQKRTQPMSMPTLSAACSGGAISYSV